MTKRPPLRPGATRRDYPKRSTKPIKSRGPAKAKREARNKAYYASAEWRVKRKAVFVRDQYQCTETFAAFHTVEGRREIVGYLRCPNRGEIVNGKQTARGLVAEEQGYLHRGIPDSIDRIVTRCKDCDRRLTPRERANHTNGFNNGRRS